MTLNVLYTLGEQLGNRLTITGYRKLNYSQVWFFLKFMDTVKVYLVWFDNLVKDAVKKMLTKTKR